MKKKVGLLCLICIMTLIAWRYMLLKEKDIWLQVGDDGMLYAQAVLDQSEERIYPWRDEQGDEIIYYFFLPAFVEERKFWFYKDSIEILSADGRKAGAGNSQSFEWEDGEIYSIKVLGEDQNEISEQNVVFMKSANIPTVFIATASGSMEYLNQSKENEEEGSIEIVTNQGNTEYRAELPRISGRGNSSWWYDKKSYSFSLKNAQALCGLDKGKKWNLLALTNEKTKLSTKLSLDIGSILEMQYSPQGMWVDLYLNGEYAGNYLLTEAVSIGEGRVEIYDLEKENEQLNPDIELADTFSEENMKGYDIKNGKNVEGGYLLEFDSIYYKERFCGFITNNNDRFTVREPSHASKEQITYIKNFIQNIENILHENVGSYRNYIDLDSFAAEFLVEEITKNFDSYCTSTFFYKDYGDDLLYAGPIWDYDAAWGLVNHHDGWENPEYLIIDGMRDGSIDWFAVLYQDNLFYDILVNKYTEILPQLETMLDSGIDNYVEMIRCSVRMDEMRWHNQPVSASGNYVTYENNIKFLKYFFAGRLNYLNRTWGISAPEYGAPADGMIHEVSFYINGELVDRGEMEDGELLEDVPNLDKSKYEYWGFLDGRSRYWDDVPMPIYEDVVFEAKPIE